METNRTDHNIKKRASRTAFIAAVHRFLATKEKRKKFIGPDHLAYMFLSLKAKIFLSFSFFRRILLKKFHEKVPGSYEYILARTRFMDEIFIQSIKENIPQIIFPGAGYDTRSIRFQDLIHNTRIFELDAPPTQNEKKRILKKYNIQIPEYLIFVPFDFNTDDLKSTLLSSGYDPEKKSLFIWEGVTMYLSEEAVILECTPKTGNTFLYTG